MSMYIYILSIYMYIHSPTSPHGIIITELIKCNAFKLTLRVLYILEFYVLVPRLIINYTDAKTTKKRKKQCL